MSRTALLLASAAALAVYLLLWAAVGGDWSWAAVADDRMLRQFHDHTVERPDWIAFWRGVSGVLGPTALRIVALGGMVVALIRGQSRVAAFLGVTVILMGLVTVVAKGLSDRPRPATALAFERSTSFPSGHALGITVAVLAFATVLWPILNRSGRTAAVLIGIALVLLVGLARVALNVHHPTDVVAGWALGLTYYLACLAVVPPFRCVAPSAVYPRTSG